MKKLAFLVLAVAACAKPAARTSGLASGSVALSSDDALLFVADSDNDAVHVIDTKTQVKLASVPVGRWPEAVVVGALDEVYVSNRYSRSVSVIARGHWDRPIATIAVGAEPTGLAVSPDQKTLLVANVASGTVSIVDVASRSVTGEIAADYDVRAVAFTPEGGAFATIAKTGEILRLDLASKTVAARFTLPSQTPSSLDGTGTTGVNADAPTSFGKFLVDVRTPGQAVSLTVSPDGKSIFAPHVLGRQTPLSTQTDKGGYSGGGPGEVPAPVVAPAVAVIDASSAAVIQADPANPRTPPAMLLSQGRAMNGPVAAAVDPTGAWLFLVNQQSDNVTVLAADGHRIATDPLNQGVFQVVDVGAGPRGIALTRDGSRAYVHNQFDESVSILSAGSSDGISVIGLVKLASSPLPGDVDHGRRLFNAANDPRMSDTQLGGIACASCHPQARDDGRTWLFDEGPRNTPMLVGRRIAETAPYHWDGAFSDMHAFSKIVQERMGGAGVGASELDAVMAYLQWQPGPDNPARTLQGAVQPALADAAKRGAAVYTKANCTACHAVDNGLFTDNKFHDVGTLNPNDSQQRPADRFPNIGQGLNTPSLLGLFATAPYLHDGSAATLRARLDDRQGQLDALCGADASHLNGCHGALGYLSAGEKDDLEVYLRTL